MRTTDATVPLRPIAGVAIGERHPQAKFLVAGYRDPAPWMDPYLAVDHFLMDEPTFRPHPHAGFSAVTLIFEDSPGSFRNRDSIGSDLTLGPGDVHWTRAGSGIQHEEIPTTPGIAVHGAQIFIALPPELEVAAPRILHSDAADVAVVGATEGARIRVLAGQLDGYNGIDAGHDVMLFDVFVPERTSVQLDPGPTPACFVIPIDGSGLVNEHELVDRCAVGFDPGTGLVKLTAGDEPLHALVGGGVPVRHRS